MNGPFGIPGPIAESNIKEAQPSVVRALRAVAKGGNADVNLLAARAADEIERLQAILNQQQHHR